MYGDSKTTLQELKDILRDFRDKREWKKFHDPKNLAEAIAIEASELQELFLWKEKEDVTEKMKFDTEFRKEVEQELADVLMFILNFAIAVDIDLSTITKEKIEKNEKNIPLKRQRGSRRNITNSKWRASGGLQAIQRIG